MKKGKITFDPWNQRLELIRTEICWDTDFNVENTNV